MTNETILTSACDCEGNSNSKMRYIYNRKSLPAIDPSRLHNLDSAADRLIKKLRATNAESLPLTAYGKETLKDFQSKAEETIKKYVHILAWLLAPNSLVRHQSLVDYGGGHGVLSCLAKEAGFSGVVYNDIFDKCGDDARVLGQHLGCAADDYIIGDIHRVHESLRKRKLKSCALASVNVIEHIYDMDEFIRIASSLSHGAMTMVLSTSANPLNPLVRRRHFRQHNEWEYTDGPHDSSYPMDTQKAFRDVRRDIIRARVPELDTKEVEALTTATRGLRKDDIEKCAEEYCKTKKFPAAPEHPTNTCDPLTGSWQERLLNIETVTRTFESLGFSVRVLAGYYSGNASGAASKIMKRVAARILNHGISLMGEHGTRLAPCFMFQAVRG